MGELKKVGENRMGTGSVWKLLIVIGLPSIISLAVNSLYNLVDTMFVSRMPFEAGDAAAALTALGYAYPIQLIIVGIAVGTGIGANAAISRALGEGDKERADRIAGNTLFTGLIIYAVFLIFAATPLVDLYVKMYNNADENVINYTVTYLRICCCASVFHIYFCLYEKLLQSTGRTFLNMTSLVTGCVINIILDPIFISVLNLGITGAAIATVFGQAISFAMNVTFHLKFNREIGNSLKNWKPSSAAMKEIFRVGFAAIISQVLSAFMTMIMGVFLTRADNAFFLDAVTGEYSASYASAYSTFYKVQQFGYMLVFGLRSAVIPIISYNHGKGNKKRVRQGMGYGFLYSVVLMAICVVIVEAAATPLMGLFSSGFSGGEDVFGNYVSTLDICSDAARIIGISFVFAGVNILCESVFQSLKAGVPSLVVSICRQVLFVIPIVAIATSLMVNGNSRDLEWLIWASFIFAEIATAIIAMILLYVIYKKRVAPIRDDTAKSPEETETAEDETLIS